MSKTNYEFIVNAMCGKNDGTQTSIFYPLNDKEYEAIKEYYKRTGDYKLYTGDENSKFLNKLINDIYSEAESQIEEEDYEYSEDGESFGYTVSSVEVPKEIIEKIDLE